MNRQPAFTILGSAAASAAATAALLFLWIPASPTPEPSLRDDGIASLRREIAALRDELAARPLPLPSPVVAERIVDVEAGRTRDELADRCDALVARCDELERAVAELTNRLAITTVEPTNFTVLRVGDDGMGEESGTLPRYGVLQEGQDQVRAYLYGTAKPVNATHVETSAQTFTFTDRM